MRRVLAHAWLFAAIVLASRSAAAPVFVQQNCRRLTGAVSTVSVAMPSPVAQGNLLVVGIGWNSKSINPTVTDSQLNGYDAATPIITEQSLIGKRIQTWYSQVGDGGTVTVTVTMTGTTSFAGAWR